MLILLLVLLSPFVLLIPIIKGGKYVDTDQYEFDTVMVLGNKPRYGKPSEDMISRMHRATNICRDSEKDINLYLSGTPEETKLMNELFDKFFYNKYKPDILVTIVEDFGSKNTLNSIEYLRDNHIHNAIVVTSKYHVCRVRYLAKRLKCDCIVVPDCASPVAPWKQILECYWLLSAILMPTSVYKKFNK